MSLYGALFSGVSGLTAQSNKIGVISDNISNVNTIGYKQANAQFQTLVANSSNTTAYSPGGVLGVTRQQVDKQGLLQTTTSPTDIAVSGNGFFVVNQTSDSLGQVLYTRAGSFTQDSNGNFRNVAGYFLQAWPLDSDGRLPGDPGNITNTTSSANLSSLVTVNVQNVTGTATPTSSIALSANLDAGQTAAIGAGVVANMDSNDSNNIVTSTQIIAETAVNSLTRGDYFTVTTTIGSLDQDFSYGGFTVGRNITDGTGSDLGTTLPSNTPVNLANPPATTGTAATGEVIIHFTGAPLPAVGDMITLAGLAAVDSITAPQLAGRFVVQSIAGNDITIVTTGTVTNAGVDAAAGGTAVVRPFAGNILDANTPSQTFLGTTGTTNFLTSALSFTVTTVETGTVTFTYTQSAPNALSGQFNNLNNLVTAINNVDGLTARVVGNQLYIGAADGNAAISFANGEDDGSSGPPVQGGIDWISELGLVNVALNNPTLSGFQRYSTIQNLADAFNSVSGLSATVNNPTGAASVDLNVANPLDTITFTDNAYGGPGGGLNVGSPLAALGFVFDNGAIASLNGTVPAGIDPVATTSALGPAYDPTDPTKNMASGSTAAQFSRPVTVFDALGAAHNLNVAFLKTGSNNWAVEIYAQPGTDVTNSLDGTDSGLLATGTLVFNGDGTLRSVSSGLNEAAITWSNDALASEITFDWGTANDNDGLSQFDSGYNVNFVNQNGTPVGQLTGVSIDSDGFITASFNNGQTQQIYKIPLAQFTNPNELQGVTGNAYAQSSESGEVNLKQSGQSGVGTIASGALEQSNAELADQLTDMIVAQRAYQANTKVISTADSLLEELNQILR